MQLYYCGEFGQINAGRKENLFDIQISVIPTPSGQVCTADIKEFVRVIQLDRPRQYHEDFHEVEHYLFKRLNENCGITFWQPRQGFALNNHAFLIFNVRFAWMIKRPMEDRVLDRLQNNPSVALMGPRQVGKTTLAFSISESVSTVYLDLENRTDLRKAQAIIATS